MVIFGQNETTTGVEEFYIKCPVCEGFNWADIMVVSKYFHLFWVPIFPVGKDANVICKTCGVKRYGLDFDEKLVGAEYKNAKSRFRHPWFSYLGVAVISLAFLFILIESIRN